MSEPFVEMLRGATNTLGRTEEVVEIVVADPARVGEVFELYFQDDEWVRLRASSSLKRLWRHDASMVAPFVDRWIGEVAAIDQPSVQWTFAQLLDECAELLSAAQAAAATEHVKRYLEESDDWIVVNSSIQTLGNRAADDAALRKWLLPRLRKQAQSHRKSTAGRATKALAALEKPAD